MIPHFRYLSPWVELPKHCVKTTHRDEFLHPLGGDWRSIKPHSNRSSTSAQSISHSFLWTCPPRPPPSRVHPAANEALCSLLLLISEEEIKHKTYKKKKNRWRELLNRMENKHPRRFFFSSSPALRAMLTNVEYTAVQWKALFFLLLSPTFLRDAFRTMNYKYPLGTNWAEGL